MHENVNINEMRMRNDVNQMLSRMKLHFQLQMAARFGSTTMKIGDDETMQVAECLKVQTELNEMHVVA